MLVPIDASENAWPLRIVFGTGTTTPDKKFHSFPVNVPFLAGSVEEEIFPPVTVERSDADFSVYRSGELLIGCVAETIDNTNLEASTRRLYQRILGSIGELTLYRIWNYVPRINAVVVGLEHYRAFCRARSMAFESAWGADYKRKLPSASAVGAAGDRLAVVFVAGRSNPEHVENPEQTPAYDYPEEHGPRSPSFARATSATANGNKYLFVSGTSAIKGHATIAPGVLTEQVGTTLDNLRLVSEASGAGKNLGAGEGWTRYFKIYLRRAEDLLAARGLLEGTLLREGDRVTWLRADICRTALNIEIEATLVGKV